jgi:HK97 family phage portal protein
LGDVSGSTSWGSGIEQQFIGWVQTSLGGWITMAEQRINRELLPGGEDSPLYAEYILEGLLRGDSASRADFYSKAIQCGWMNRNEVRVRENMQPTDELDGFLTPMNMAITNDDGTVVGLGGAQTIEVDDGDTAG